MIKPLFSRRWILATLLVLVGFGVLVRLGIWQRERLNQRREFNARVQDQIDADPLALDAANLDADLHNMEFRRVIVTGTYLHADQIALRNQAVNGRVGVHLVTPLRIAGSAAVIFIDRGWIPAEDAAPQNWGKYDELGQVIVHGRMRRSTVIPPLNIQPDPTLMPDQIRLDTWTALHLERIAEQLDYPILPVFVQHAIEDGRTDFPVRNPTEIELDEGSHESYMLQWWAFALMLLIGYPFFVRNQEQTLITENGANHD